MKAMKISYFLAALIIIVIYSFAFFKTAPAQQKQVIIKKASMIQNIFNSGETSCTDKI